MSSAHHSGARRSVWTVLAAATLVILSLPFGAVGVLALNEIVIRGHEPGGSGGVFELFVGLGVCLSLVAVLHLYAAVSTWRGRFATARLVGWAGLALGGVAFGGALFGAVDVAAVVLAFPLAYGALLVCLRNSQRERDGSAATDQSNPSSKGRR